MAGRVVRALVRRAGDGDTEALEQLIMLDDLLPAAIRDAGAALHRFGYSYTELGDVAGISRQAARERFSDTPNMPAMPAPVAGTSDTSQMGLAR